MSASASEHLVVFTIFTPGCKRESKSSVLKAACIALKYSVVISPFASPCVQMT